MTPDQEYWYNEFRIHSEVELDFVIGQAVGWPVGMQSDSPPEFRRRVLAAAISYQLQLKSIDYALKRYVAVDQYENEEERFGDRMSKFISSFVSTSKNELFKLHTPDPSFGQFGAEITMFRIPELIDVCRVSANRGLLLENFPMFRLCLEMVAWASIAFHGKDESSVVNLEAQTCITRLKNTYATAGKFYGYLSRFAHWNQRTHGHLLEVRDHKVMVKFASSKYRAISLSICFVLIDLFLTVNKTMYGDAARHLIDGTATALGRCEKNVYYKQLLELYNSTKSAEIAEIILFMAE